MNTAMLLLVLEPGCEELALVSSLGESSLRSLLQLRQLRFNMSHPSAVVTTEHVIALQATRRRLESNFIQYTSIKHSRHD